MSQFQGSATETHSPEIDNGPSLRPNGSGGIDVAADTAAAADPRESWHAETDVIVVGHGFAGAVSAIEAHDHGAKVLLIEKHSHPAGCSPASGGSVGCINSVEKAFAYFKRQCGERTPDDVILAFCEEACKNAEYVAKLATTSAAKVQVVIGEENRMGVFDSPGREAYGHVRITDVPGFTGFGWKPGGPTFATKLMKVLMDNIKARGIEVMFSTPAKELIADCTGAVIGILAERDGGQIAIKAGKAVILASGGFEQSEEFRKQFLQGVHFASSCHSSNTGDGIRMAQKAGAALWHMWHIHGAYGFSFPEMGSIARRHSQGSGNSGRYGRETKMVWIVVDKHGKRYMNEYPPMVQDLAYRPMELFDGNLLLSPYYRHAANGYPRIPSWIVFDEPGRKFRPLGTSVTSWNTYSWSQDNSQEIDKGWIIKADTLRQLAAMIKGDPDNDGLMCEENLQRTVSRWNEIVAAGQIDPDFLRGPESMFGPIATSPFYAAKVWPVINNTQGGPVHNARQQVLDPFQRPIPGFYAAGEMGSLFGHIYETGGNIAECFTSGRIAGQQAAAEQMRG